MYDTYGYAPSVMRLLLKASNITRAFFTVTTTVFIVKLGTSVRIVIC